MDTVERREKSCHSTVRVLYELNHLYVRDVLCSTLTSSISAVFSALVLGRAKRSSQSISASAVLEMFDMMS